MKKVFKIEVMIIDHDDVGEEDIKYMIENARYPNHAISPDVKGMEYREVEWSDDHPLNKVETAEQFYRKLFEEKKE